LEEEFSRYNWWGVTDNNIVKESMECDSSKCKEVGLKVGSTVTTVLGVLGTFGILKGVDTEVISHVTQEVVGVVCVVSALAVDLFKDGKSIIKSIFK
jgi:hypothetical protein